MLALKRELIEEIYTMEMAIDAAEKSMVAEAEIPLRTNFDIPEKNGQVLYMPAYIKGEGVTGIKLISVYPDNDKKGIPVVPAQMILMDPETGEVMSIIDGTLLTQMRTAAIQGLATKLLSRENSKIGLVIGTGGQSLYQIEAMLTVRDLEKLYIYDLDIEKSKALEKTAKEKLSRFSTEIKAVEDIDSAISEADIITAVTTSKRPVFDGSKVKEGVHVNGVGAYTKEMIEVPGEYLKKTEKIFMDSENGVMSEAGDVLKAIEDGELKEENCYEIKDLIEGKAEGRKSDSEYTFFKTVGTAVLDVVTAWEIYKIADEKGVGEKVDI